MKIIIKNLDENKLKQLNNLVDSWDDFNKRLNFKMSDGACRVIFFSKEHEKEIEDFKRNLINFCISENKEKQDIYREKIRPMFLTFSKLAFETCLYNKNLVTETDIEDMKQKCELTLFQALDSFDPINHYTPEYYFMTTALNSYFQSIRRIEKYKKRNLLVDDESEYDNLIKDFLSLKEESTFEFDLLYKFFQEKKKSKSFQGKPEIKIFEFLSDLEKKESVTKKDVLKGLREETGLNTKQIYRKLKNIEKSFNIWMLPRRRKDDY